MNKEAEVKLLDALKLDPNNQTYLAELEGLKVKKP